MRALRTIGCVVSALAVSLAPTPSLAAGSSAADHLAAARRHYDDVEFVAALGEYQKVTNAADATPGQRAEAYLGMGFSLAALGRTGEATDAVAHALTIRPDLPIPDGLSPKLQSVVDAARGRRTPLTPTLTVVPRKHAGTPPRVFVEVRDPGKVVSSLDVRWRPSSGGKLRDAFVKRVDAGRFQALLDGAKPGQAVSIVAVAKNAYGYLVATAGEPEHPIALHLPGAAPAPTPRPKPHVAPPPAVASTGRLGPYAIVGYTGVGLGVATAGLGIFFGSKASSLAAEYNGPPTHFASQSDALKVGATAQNDAMAANLLLGLGTALAVGGALTVLLAPHPEPPVSFSVAPTRGGAGLMVAGRFP